MPSIILNIDYPINTSVPFSAQDLRDKFLSGLPNEFNGSAISDETINFYIESAFTELESYLALKLSRQVIKETKDYYLDDWLKWGYIKTTYPVMKAVSLDGYIGSVKQIVYPAEWISARRSNDGRTYNRTFMLIPASENVTYANMTAYLMGTYPYQLSWWRQNRNIPNYWEISYITGFPEDKIPADILRAIGMLASVPVLGIISDMWNGSRGIGFGVSSKSISIDGLSQSVSSYSNGDKGIFGARIKQYGDQLLGDKGRPGLLDILKDSYSQILMAVC